MTRPARPRNRAAVTGMTLLTFALGATLAVLVAGSASAAGSKGKTTTKKTTTSTKATTTAATPTPASPTTSTPDSPGSKFFVINGTANAASDHEIIGSSAFPNFTTGAVDNYYSMAHSHVDNSPFAEGTASPADTGPIGQTAAAGNFQQPQYADARWPGDANSGKASYGNQGGPFATAEAGEYRATADASEATNGLSGPGLGGSKTLAAPKGFDGRLRAALATWKAKWQGRPAAKKPAPSVTTPVATVTVPKAPIAKPKVSAPVATLPTPVATVTTPSAPVTGGSTAPQVTAPTATLPTGGGPILPGSASKSRSLSDASAPADGESLLASSSLANLDAKTNTLVTSGESRLGRVSLGGGQIVIEGIHVSASIANNGTPSYKAAVSIASATIGGVPVTIDQDGVHVAGQGAALPYQQASDALNGALKQAGIQLFLVSPEVKTPCGQSGSSGGSSTTSTSTTTTTATTTTTPTSSDQSGSSSPNSCDQSSSASSCDSSGGSGGTGPSLPSVGGSSTSTDTTTTQGSCDQTDTTASCGDSGTTTNGSTTTTGGVPGIGPSTTTNKSTTTSKTTTTGTTSTGTTSTTSSGGCGDQSGPLPPIGSCGKAGTSGGTSTTSTNQTDTNAAPNPFDPTGGNSAASEETVTATGLHVVFTQPVSPSGVPSQFVEHILGEVFVDSLAVPAGPPPNIDLSSASSPSTSSGSSTSSSSCGGSHSGGTKSGGGVSAGGSTGAGGSGVAGSSTAGGSTASGAPSGASFGSGSQPGSGGGNSLPAAFAAALRKPLWLLLAYVLWQAITIGTGASLWNWRREA